MSSQDAVKILSITWTFIRIIIVHKEGGGHLSEATVFDNSWKIFEIFKFSSNDCYIYIDIVNKSTCNYTSVTTNE